MCVIDIIRANATTARVVHECMAAIGTLHVLPVHNYRISYQNRKCTNFAEHLTNPQPADISLPPPLDATSTFDRIIRRQNGHNESV